MRIAVSCLAMLAFLAISLPARAALVPINFTGTAQTFSDSVTLPGNAHATGSGATKSLLGKVSTFVLTPPLDHPLNLVPSPTKIATNPITSPLGTIFDLSSGSLNDMQGLNLDLFNGSTEPFALNTISITTNSSNALLKVLDIDVSATITGLTFTQTGAPTITGGGGSGTFSVPGTFNVLIPNPQADIGSSGFTVTTIAIPALSANFDQALEGTWTMSGPDNNTHIELNGGFSVNSIVTLQTALATTASVAILLPGLTVSTTLDLMGTLTLASLYHLEQSNLVVPEPGSIALLFLGVASAIPMIWKRRKNQARGTE